MLCKASKDHVLDAGSKGIRGHVGSDKTNPRDRITRYGEAVGFTAENISYVERGALEIVMQLYVDDGVKNRGHRANMINKNLRVVGIASGDHTKLDRITVFDYATDVKDPNKPEEKGGFELQLAAFKAKTVEFA